MIVCHCQVVSDRHIRREVQSGAYDTDEVGDRHAAPAPGAGRVGLPSRRSSPRCWRRAVEPAA